MIRIDKPAVAVVSTVAFSVGAAAAPAAFAAKPEPCATQQAHVDKATAKLGGHWTDTRGDLASPDKNLWVTLGVTVVF